MIYKNVASQKIGVFAYDSSDGSAKTGDAGNITAYISLDFAAPAQTNDVNPTELDATNAPGWYVFDLTQGETNAEVIILAAQSATADILIEQVQVVTQDASISSRATQASVDVVDGVVDAILVDTGTDIPASITALNDLNATDAADAVWDELIAGHLGAGTTGASLNAAGAAGDPWLTPLPGAYVAGTAGYIIGNCAVNIVNYIASHISAIGNLLRRRSSDLGCLYRGDTWTDTIGGLGDLSTATNIWVAFKKKSNDPDSAALLLVSMDVGLEVINQAPAAIPLNGSVGVVAPATGGFIDFYVHQDETAKLEPDKYHYDIQVETPYGAGSRIDTRRAGTVIIEGDIVRTTT
jgi:hypothetical protein